MSVPEFQTLQFHVAHVFCFHLKPGKKKKPNEQHKLRQVECRNVVMDAKKHLPTWRRSATTPLKQQLLGEWLGSAAI